MERTYRVGTRTSPLALKQVEEVLNILKGFYPGMQVEVIGIDTYGDKDKDTPISEIEGTDFFTREIDEALLKNEIDFSVHSAKDLPDESRDDLVTPAVTSSIDSFDALVSKSGLTLDKLPEGARIGTSSLRRKAQLKEYRKDFEIVDIRGNIEERLMLLDDNYPNRIGSLMLQNEYDLFCNIRSLRQPTRLNIDAIVIAACALTRLGLSHRITQRIPLEILKPHPLQGGLAIVARAVDLELVKLLSVLNGARH